MRYRLKYDWIFRISLALPCILILFTIVYLVNKNINVLSTVNLQSMVLMFTYFQSLGLVLFFVLVSILMRNLPRYLPIYYFSDEVNHENEDIKETAKQIVKFYEIKLVLLVVLFITLLFQLISIGFKIGLRIDGYNENAFVILLVGLIIMSYPNNVEDIIYIIHKLKLCASTKKASPNLYYLLGYKLDKIFKNDIFGELRSSQKPMLYKDASAIHSMGILAIHSTFNSSYWDDNLKKFYNGLLVYLLEKNYTIRDRTRVCYEAGADAINSLGKKIDEIKFLDQKEKIYLFIWEENSNNIDKPLEFMSEKPLEYIKANFESNLVSTDNRETNVGNNRISLRHLTINVGYNCITLSVLEERGTDGKIVANLTTDDEGSYEFPAKIKNGKINIYGELKSRILGFELDSIKSEHKMMDKKYILANCILNEPKCSISIIILSIISSIIFTTLWAVGM